MVTLQKKNIRRIIGAIVCIALCAVVWWLGPVFSLESWAARALVCVLIVVLWLGLEVLWHILRLRRDAKLKEAVSQVDPAEGLSKAEAEAISQRFREALTRFEASSRNKSGRTAMLYELPWYIFIGAPGSGKTTALLNSGLRFPLSGNEAGKPETKGIGGTRNCDWFFTDQAVLIDTAGRLTTQDSNAEVDEVGWKTFLSLLRRHRPKQPINGALVTISISDLLDGAGESVNDYAAVVRNRINELQTELGMRFPVYLLITKCDLLPGFTDFFGDLDAERRGAVWGHTFDYDLKSQEKRDPVPMFANAFSALVERVNKRLIQRLSEERDVDRRFSVYPFPQQFASLESQLCKFIENAFGFSNLHEPPLLRGFYFTSGTQQGASIDRLMAGLNKSLSAQRSGAAARPMPASGGAAKAYFMRALLQDVIFREAGLAGFNENRERRLRLFAWVGIAVLSILATGLAAAWINSFFRNRTGLDDVNSRAREIQSAIQSSGPRIQNDLVLVAALLDEIRNLPKGIADPPGTEGLGMHWGLFQGDAVHEQAQSRYRSALRSTMLPIAASQLEEALRDPSLRPEDVYSALKAYLMLFPGSELDVKYFANVVAGLVEKRSGAGLAQRLKIHFAEVARLPDLKASDAISKNEELVTAARKRAAATSSSARAYAMLKSGYSEAEPVRLSEWLGASGVAIFEMDDKANGGATVDRFFSGASYKKYLKPKLSVIATELDKEERWILGPEASKVDATSVQADVRDRFFKEANEYWSGLLSGLRLKKITSVTEAVRVARILSRNDSPLRQFMQKALEEIQWPPDKSSDGASATRAELEKRATSMASSIVGEPGARILAGAARDGALSAELAYERRFEPLRQALSADKSADVNAAISDIAEIGSELEAMQLNRPSGLFAVPESIRKKRIAAARYPAPMSAVIKDLTDFASGEAAEAVKQSTTAELGGAASFCSRATGARYPFVRTSQEDVGIEEFSTIFAKGSDYEAFFDSRLKAVVEKGASWRMKPGVDTAPTVAPAVLRQFQNMEAIRFAFLGNGSSAKVNVDISMVGGEGETQLEYDGRSHRLKVGAGAVHLSWPAASGARLTQGGSTIASVDGTWALFRLFDKGAADTGAALTRDRLRRAYVAPNGAKITLEWRASSPEFNPFQLRELTNFSCPR